MKTGILIRHLVPHAPAVLKIYDRYTVDSDDLKSIAHDDINEFIEKFPEFKNANFYLYSNDVFVKRWNFGILPCPVN